MTLFMFFTVFAVTGVSAWSLFNNWQTKLSDHENSARNLSVSLSKQAEDAFLQVDIILAEAAILLDQNGFDYATSAAFLAQIKEQQGKLHQVSSISIIDNHGQRIVSTGRSGPEVYGDKNRDYFLFHLNQQDPGIYIGRGLRSPYTGELVIPVSVRLNDTRGRFMGVALATIKVDYFRQFYGYYNLGKRDVLGLVLADSSVLYIRPFPDTYMNRSLSASPLFESLLKSSDSGSATWRSSLDNVERIFGYARLDRYPLIVAAGYDRDAVRAEWVSQNIVGLSLNAILLLIMAGMGFVMLRQLSVNLTNQLELVHMRDELTSINHTLQSMAMVDGLTGLANRRQFDALLESSLQDSVESDSPVSLIMTDIDCFKHYNDTYGHVAGDRCLKRVAILLEEIFHSHEAVVARYGGEEFAIILPHTDSPEAEKFARDAVRAVYEAGIPHVASDGYGQRVTISAGCSTLVAKGAGGEAEQLKENADRMLYLAKGSGRNRAMSDVLQNMP